MEDNNEFPPNTLIEDELASRWDRLWAALIDSILAILLSLPVMSYLGIFELTMAEQEIPLNTTIKMIVFGVVIFFILHGYLLNRYGQTVGKYFMKISIVDLENRKPEFKSLIVKRYLPIWFMSYMPVIGVFVPTIDSLFIFRKDKRCIHDLIAGTKVVNNSANKSFQSKS